MPGVACPVAGGLHIVVKVTPKSSGDVTLIDCHLARMVVDHSLTSGVMHSLAGMNNHKVA